MEYILSKDQLSDVGKKVRFFFYLNETFCTRKRKIYSEDDRYCILVKLDDFRINPNKYIELVFDKKEQYIVKDVVAYPK